MSKLAHFLLDLAKSGFLDFRTPLELEFDYFEKKVSEKKNVEIRPFLSKLALERFLSYFMVPRANSYAS